MRPLFAEVSHGRRSLQHLPKDIDPNTVGEPRFNVIVYYASAFTGLAMLN
jgi:hypothetical protein